MAPSSFSLLLRHFSKTPKFHHRILSPLLKHHFSSNTPASSSKPPSSSLSARLSFVFDKIDEIEKERSEKDEALQRIRAWRESKKPNHHQQPDINDTQDQNLGLGFSESAAIIDDNNNDNNQLMENRKKREIELAHPWPEWIELMERLVHHNYFDHRRKDEDKMIEGLGGSIDGDVEDEDDLGFDFTRDWKTVHAAILNFGKDRFDIFRSLSRQDIQLLVGYGCPNADKKVVFSSKLLRKYVHLDEGDVCSSCSLRNSCERAYLVTNKEDEARTIDVMRVLLTYGFDAINGSVENKSLLKKKSVKSAVRKLLHEIVRLSAVPIDPNLPPPVIKQRPPKVKQPPPPPKRRVGRDDIEMKKGDWLCPKCNFMNFAKNVVCLQCDAKRPKRQLLPGEWECPQCNFLNYRRNMACFNCEHKRPPDEYTENQMQGRQHRPVTRPGRVVNREELPNAWNFDFDDDESDGADVAAFEYADAHAMNEDRLLDNQLENGNFNRVPDEELYRVSRSSRSQEKEHSRPFQMQHGMGFDDFDDEDDDLDSYELDDHNRSKEQEASPVQFSDLEGYSETEAEDDMPGYSRSHSHSYAKTSRSSHNKGALSDSVDDDLDFDSDEDLPVHPKWKSSHVADSGRRHRGSQGPSNRNGFGSDEDERLAFGSDDDLQEDFRSRQGRGNIRNPEHRSFRRGDDSNRNRKQSGFRGRQDVNFVQGDRFDDEFGRPSRGYRGNKSGSFDNKRGGHRMNGRERGTNASRRQGSGNIGRRRFNESDNWSDVDNDRPIRQRINVR